MEFKNKKTIFEALSEKDLRSLKIHSPSVIDADAEIHSLETYGRILSQEKLEIKNPEDIKQLYNAKLLDIKNASLYADEKKILINNGYHSGDIGKVGQKEPDIKRWLNTPKIKKILDPVKAQDKGGFFSRLFKEEEKVTKLNEQILRKLILEELENMQLEQIELEEEQQIDEGIKKWLAGLAAAAALAFPGKAKADTYNVEIKNAITGEVVHSTKAEVDPSKVEAFKADIQKKLADAGKNYNVSVNPEATTAPVASQVAGAQIGKTKSGAKTVEVSASSELEALKKGSGILKISADKLRAVGDPTGKTWKVIEIK